jgi:two-component system sensor histidine kinase DesK
MNPRNLLHAAPDSLVMLTHARHTRPAIPWFPIVNLVWLIWMAAAPWMFNVVSTRVVVLTYASIALFLWLYHRAWFGSRARLPWAIAAIAVLGLAIIPVNSSWSYVIYAGSLIPFATRGWRAVAWLALLLAAFYVVALSTRFFTPLVTASCIVTTAVIALLNGVYRKNGERDAELRLTQDEVRRLAIAAERERIGRDLHDLLGHTLSLVAVKSELARRLVARDPQAAERELADIEGVARNALAEVREAVTGMRMAGLASEVASARLMLEAGDVALQVAGIDTPLEPAAEAALAYGLREAITNIHRHARATRVDVELGIHDGSVALRVQDNGRGAVSPRGNGLAGMEERLVALGGRLSVTSEAGRGMTIVMSVPYRPGSMESDPVKAVAPRFDGRLPDLDLTGHVA